MVITLTLAELHSFTPKQNRRIFYALTAGDVSDLVIEKGFVDQTIQFTLDPPVAEATFLAAYPAAIKVGSIACCAGGSGTTVTIETNGTPNASQTLLNFIDSPTIEFSNPAGGDVEANLVAGIGIPGGSNTQVQFNDAGSFGGDAGLTYNKTTNVLSVNGSDNSLNLVGSSTGNPATLEATGSDASVPIWIKPKGIDEGVTISAFHSGPFFENVAPFGQLNLVSDGMGSSDTSILLYEANGPDGFPSIVGFASRGTPASPAAVQATDPLLNIVFSGYGGSDFLWPVGAEIVARADENWVADTTNGGKLIFSTAAHNDWGSVVQRMTIDMAGLINISSLTASRLVATDASKNMVSTITSANLAASISDETGSGAAVFGTSPTIVTPTIAKLANLTSNGFVKTSGGDGTLSVDTNTYLTAATGFTVGKHIAVPQIASRI